MSGLLGDDPYLSLWNDHNSLEEGGWEVKKICNRLKVQGVWKHITTRGVTKIPI